MVNIVLVPRNVYVIVTVYSKLFLFGALMLIV